MKFYTTIIFLSIFIVSCKTKSKLTKITPNIITEQTPNDSDDPAIWINAKNPSESIIFGTDKSTDGGIYAFNLEGKIIPEKSIKNVKRPNNVDIVHNFHINDSTMIDVMAFTERETQKIRIFSVPDMTPLDNGGFDVFEDATEPEFNLPMGIALYLSPKTNKLYAIVARKNGPKNDYLYQYEIRSNKGRITSSLVRKFGSFSGKKEIEAIAVDHELGFIYYSDEQCCVKKYYAEPSKGNEEISSFGADYFLEDIEGIAIAKTDNGNGYIIISNQQLGEFNIFDRKTNAFIKAVNLSTSETDGCDVTTVPLNNTFKNGIFVAMNDNRDFFFYDLKKILP